MHVLKAGPHRTVTAVDKGGERVIVKRFHHQSPWQAWRDRGRARAEFRALQKLEGLGFRVPHPVALSFANGQPEIHMREVPGARTLESLLEGRLEQAVREVSWEVLLRRLGELLARLHLSGMRHPDLHPGNVLVDTDDRPWLIDLHNVRQRRRRVHPRAALRELIACAAHGREFLPVRLRTRFLIAWRKATGLPVDARCIESEARAVRRRAIAAGAGRWQRESSRCRIERLGARVILHARVLPAATETSEIAYEGSEEELRARWTNATRLVEHHVPAAWPLRLELEQGAGRAVFLVGHGACGPASKLGRSAALHALLTQLHDRGLDLVSATEKDLTPSPNGAYLLRPPFELLEEKEPPELR